VEEIERLERMQGRLIAVADNISYKKMQAKEKLAAHPHSTVKANAVNQLAASWEETRADIMALNVAIAVLRSEAG